ncbi:MAG: hypothetical protein ACRD1K_20540 [Acidimicrobiales bacterium]
MSAQPESEQPEPERAVALYHGPAERAAALARYASAKLVRIQAERLMLTEKSKQGLEWNEALLVAQASLATGLSPFEPQPELWHWITVRRDDQNRPQRILTIMRGRDGTIRLAEESARRDGTYLLPARFDQITEAREKLELGFAETDIVFRALVTDQRSAAEYYDRRRQLKEEGLASDAIDHRLGEIPPGDIGYACLTVTERSALEKRGDARFAHVNRVQKRALVEALKKRWAALLDVQSFAMSAPSDPDAYVVEAEWQEVQVIEGKARKVERSASAAEGVSGKRPYPPATVWNAIGQRLLKFAGTDPLSMTPHPQLQLNLREFASWMLQECFVEADLDKAACAQTVAVRLFDHPAAELSGPEAMALLEWLDPKPNKQGDFVPNVLSVKEARLIWKEVQNGEAEKAQEDRA